MNMHFKLVVYILHKAPKKLTFHSLEFISLQSLKFSCISAFNANKINP
jgi:hypothetical protein